MTGKIKYKLIIGLLTAIACLPLSVMYILSDLIYLIAYKVLKYRRRVVRRNLDRVFGDRTKDERREIERKFYRHLCDVIVETVKLLHISDREIYSRAIVTNGELIDRIFDDGHSVVLMLGHYGNWEWVQTIPHYFHTRDLTGMIYRPLSDKTMDQVMLKIRSRFGFQCIPMKTAVRTLLMAARQQQKFIIGFISDQRPLGKAQNNWMKFLGLETSYMVGGESIADHVDAKMVYVHMECPKRGYYTMTFVPIEPAADDHGPNPYTRRFMDMLQQDIYEHPELWLWSHDRWKWRKCDSIQTK